jgi:hypothetical protein
MADVLSGTDNRLTSDVLSLVSGSAWTGAGRIVFRRRDDRIYSIAPDGSGERVEFDLGDILERFKGR